jgi:hypothetical protein
MLPIAPLPDLVRWWRSQKTRGLIIGGLAVALLGRPRVTRDVDAMILLAEGKWPAFLDAGRAFGFLPRVPEALAFAREARVLLVRHHPSGIDVDIALGSLAFEREALDRARRIKVGGVTILIPTPEDLIIMKAIAHRERDALDIEGLLAAHSKLDRRRIRRWVREFADALESSDIYDDLQRQLARKRPGK